MILHPARPFYIYYDYIFGSRGLMRGEEIPERINVTPATTYIHTPHIHCLFMIDMREGEMEYMLD